MPTRDDPVDVAEITSEWEGGKQIISDSADELHDAIYLSQCLTCLDEQSKMQHWGQS